MASSIKSNGLGGPQFQPFFPLTAEAEYHAKLDAWVQNSAITGDKQEAASRIRKALRECSEQLDLSRLNLTSLPPLDLLNAQLQTLDLNDNKLTELPSAIGDLSSLQKLYLRDNTLTELPPAIGDLSSLEELDLGRNQLTELPTEIGELSSLEEISLASNKLTALPSAIGDLSSLQWLSLGGNKLTALPPVIGDLSSLQLLDISFNPELSELPLSLGSLRNLTDLDILGTKILPAIRNAILISTRNLRNAEAMLGLPNRLKTWQIAAGETPDSTLLSTFEKTQQEVLHEWLVRLEKTKDFRGHQRQLAQAVCGILLTASQDPDFQQAALSQMEANNTDCADRAASALNELYTTWCLVTLPQEASLSQKLQVLSSGAKTLALRATLTELIVAHEKETNRPELEATEIFLYYELSLKETLNLLSLISGMSHGDIGNRGWICEADLIEAVEQTYEKYLFDFPAFEPLALQDPTYTQELELLRSKMESDVQMAAMNEASYVATCDQIKDTYASSVFKLKQKLWDRIHSVLY